MTKKEKIEYLKAAEMAFREKPSIANHNHAGLCDYLARVFSLDEYQICEILDRKFRVYEFTFCNGLDQLKAYILPELRFERADWCKSEIERLERGE